MSEELVGQEIIDQIDANEHVSDEVKKKVIHGLADVEDPELGIDIVNLGLVYGIHMDENGHTEVEMTLTAMGCPLAGTIVTLVKEALADIPEVKEADVNIVWNPPWSRDRVSRLGKMALGIQ